MNSVRWAVICWVLAGLILAGDAKAAAPQSQSPPSADEIIRRAVCRDQGKDKQNEMPAYSYTKVTVTEEFDSAGKVKERKERLYKVSYKDGFTSARLLSVNGRPPAPADLKRQAEYESDARLLSGGSKSSSGNRQESILTPELAAHFQYSLRGQTEINGRLTYEITFQPKMPAPPIHHVMDRLLNRISGTLWVDAQEFEIARADLRLSSEVDLLAGVIGCLKKLQYTLTRTRVAEGVWLNTCSSGDFEGRKLLESLRIKTRSHSLNFHPLGFPS